MAKVTTAMIKELRERTQAGMLDCKKALKEVDGDMDKAIEFLRKKGLSKAAKKAGRIATEGAVVSYIHPNNRVGVLLEVNCETDFVAGNEDFKAFCHGVAMTVAAFNPKYLNKEAIPAEDVEKEQAIVTEMTKESMAGKPDNVIEKAVTGRMEKWYGEHTLMAKPYVPDDSKTIEQMRTDLVAKIGENIQVRRFFRMELGG